MQDGAEQKDKSQKNQNLTFLFGEMNHGESLKGKPAVFGKFSRGKGNSENYIHQLIGDYDKFFNIFSRQMQLNFCIGENHFL